MRAAADDRSARRATLLFLALSYAAALALAGLHLSTPSDDAIALLYERKQDRPGVPVAPVSAGSALRTGDVVLAVAGLPVEMMGIAPGPAWRPGDTVVYQVIREGREVSVPVVLSAGSPGPALDHWGELLFGLALQLVGLYVFVRRPREAAGSALNMAGGAALASAWMRALQGSLPDAAAGPAAWWLAVASGLIYIVFYAGVLHLFLVFPGRHPILSRWRRAIALAYLLPTAIMAAAFTIVFAATPVWWSRLLVWGAAVRAVNVVLVGLAILALVTGYRATRDAALRQKTKWVAFGAAALGAVTLVFRQLPGVIWDVRPLGTNESWVVGLILPLALAISIMRHQLFDIDVLINRALVYGALTAIVTAVYALIVVAFAGLIGARGSVALSLAATALIALIFQPLRERLQRAANRMLYGEQNEPYGVLSRLGKRLEAAYLPGQAFAAIVEAVSQALKLPYAALFIGEGAARHLSADHGRQPARPDQLVLFPLIYQGERAGELAVQPREAGEGFSETERRLIEDIAHQAGPAAYAQTLMSDLQRSRERLVTAREEERRRLRRDIHDGIGTTLTGVRLLIGRAMDRVASEPEASALLSDAKGQTQQAIADIRRLVYDLRPPVLDELGLAAALREHAARFGYELIADEPLPALSAAVEVAAYRIAAEAMSNVARHARASRCVISISLDAAAGAQAALRVSVDDNGAGIPERTRAGVGIGSMRERAAELGGSLDINRLAEGGTRLSARLPLAPP
ncbi:MAG: histidine kinase [Thermoflexales bacterium]